MRKWLLKWLGIMVLLSAQALAAEVNYSDGEDNTGGIAVDVATELKFGGVTATQSGDISGTDVLTITGGTGTLNLTGDNSGFTGTVAHDSGTLVFADDLNLFELLSKYSFQGDATITENQAVKNAIIAYRNNPTDENRQLLLDAIDTARNAGALPTFMIADDSGVNIDGSGGNTQRLTIATGKAGSFHLESGAKLTFKDSVYSRSSGVVASGGAIYVNADSLLALTAADNASGYVFSNNSTSTLAADAMGGAIYNNGTIVLSNTEFTGNYVTTSYNAGHGGAIYSAGISIMENVTFTDNYVNVAISAALGGAIRNNGTMTLNNADFTNNSAISTGATSGSAGGAIYNTGTMTLSNASFTGNSANATGSDIGNSGNGGAIHNSGTAPLIIENTDFRNNIAYSYFTGAYGGAIYNNSNDALTLNVTADQESVFTGNVAVSRDGDTISANSVHFQNGSLAVNTDEEAILDMRDPMRGNTTGNNTTSITKSGAGAWKLGGESIFAHSATGKAIFTVNEGTLYLYRAGEVDNANPTYTAGAMVKAGSISLAGANSSFTLGSGATLSVGGGVWEEFATTAPNTIASPTIIFGDDTTLSFDLAHHDATATNEMLTLTGTVVLTNANDMTIDITSLNSTAGTYTLVRKTNASRFDGINYTLTLRGEEITNPRVNLIVTATENEINVTQSGGLENVVLTWTGDNNNKWDTSVENWTDVPGGTPTIEQFMQGDIVNFANASGEQSVEVNAGGVQAAGMYVSGGATYEFSGGEIVLDGTDGTTFTNPPDTAASGKLVLGANATTSSSIDAAAFTGIADFSGTVQNTFKGGVDLHSGKLRISDEEQLGTTLAYVSYLADLFSSATLAGVKTAINTFKTTPTPENEALMLTVIAAAQDEGYLPAIIIAEDSDVAFGGSGGDSQRLVIANGKAASFHLEDGASLTFKDTVNDQGGSYAHGGAVYVGDDSLLSLTADDNADTYVFTNNHASSTANDAMGGVIYNNGAITMTNARFIDNDAVSTANSANGGAIHNSGVMTLNNTDFTNNTAASTADYLPAKGGAIHNGGTMTLDNANFADNSATSTSGNAAGGAIYNFGPMILNNANFMNNHVSGASVQGGAIYTSSSSAMTLNVTANRQSVFTGNVTVQGSTINANSIYFNGGGSLAVNTGEGAVLDMRDPMRGAASSAAGISITKSDEGIWKLGGTNTFTSSGAGKTAFAVGEGTLYLYRAGEVDNANPTYTPDAKVAAGNISLAGAGSAFTLAGDAVLSVGGVGHSIAVSDGEIGLAAGSVLAFDMTDATTSTTNLALTAADFTGAAIGSGEIELTNFAAKAASANAGDAFTLVDTGTAGETANTGDLYVNGVRHYTGRSDKEYGLATDADAKQLQIKFIDATQNADLTWTGSQNGNWNETDGNWKGMIDGVNVNKFQNGDSVTFDDTATRKNVTVDADGVVVDKMTVSDSDYVFNLTAGQTAAIAATGTDGSIDLGNATLNITGYAPAADTDHFTDPMNVLTLISTDNGVSNFNSEIRIAGQTLADSFLTASAYLDDSDKKVKVATGLRWYSTDPTREAHGNFDIAADNAFTLGAVLADNSASTNKTAGWDGNSLTKNGSGSLILAAANTYTGKTSVNAGILQLDHADAVALSDVSVLTGATLAVGQTSNVKSLSLTDATLSISAGDTVNATGTITLSGVNQIEFAMTQIVAGSYDILTGADVTGFDANNFTTLINGNSPSGRTFVTYYIDDLDTTVTLDLSILNLDLTWMGGSGDWSDANWEEPDDNTFYNGDSVTFAFGSGDVTVADAGVEVNGMTVSGGAYSFGGGSISSPGAGKLTISDASATFANDINFADGIEVRDGGELYGSGSARMSGGVSVATGGTFGATSGATPTLDSLTMAAGSTFAITDSLTSVIGGANISSGVNFTFGSDLYAGNAYTVLTSGGITGWTGPEEYSSGFLRYIVDTVNGTDLRVLVEMYRKLLDIGLSHNQAAALSGLESWNGGTNELYNAILALNNDDDARRALSALTGQIHANLPASLIRQNSNFWQLLDGPVLSLRKDAEKDTESVVIDDSCAYASIHPRARLNRQPLLWFSAGGLNSRSKSDYDTARDRTSGHELMIGDETVLAGWNTGLAFRYADTRLKIDDRTSRAKLDNYQLGLYATRETCLGDGELRFTLGAAGGYHDIGTTRQVAYGSINQRLKADYDAWSLSGIAEVAYRLKETRNLALEPYLALGWDSVWNGAFNESGGSAALLGNAKHQGNFSATAGLRFLYQLSNRISVNAKAGWRHSFGSMCPQSSLAFMDSPTRDLFTINGTRLVRDEFVGGVGVRMDLSKNVFIRTDYNIEAGNGGFAHRGTMSAGVGF